MRFSKQRIFLIALTVLLISSISNAGFRFGMTRAVKEARNEVDRKVFNLDSQNTCDSICLSTETIVKDSSGVEDKQNLVIRDNNDWKNLWRSMRFLQATPEVCFKNCMVIAAFEGETGWMYSFNIASMTETNHTLNVFLHAVSPGHGCAVPQMVGTPSHIVKLRRIDKQVIFHETKEVINCE